MTQIDPLQFVYRCLFAPSRSSIFRQINAWLRGRPMPL